MVDRDRIKEGFIDPGEKELKNIARPVRAYALKTGAEGPASALDASAFVSDVAARLV